MAAHIHTTPSGVDASGLSSQRLLRAAGPCRVLTSAEVIALTADAPPIALGPQVDRDRFDATPPNAAARHTRVLRQHDAGGRPRAPQGLVASFRQRRHRRYSRSVLPTHVRVRS